MEKKTKLWIVLLVGILILSIGGSFAYFVSRVKLSGNGAEVNAKTASKGDTTVTVSGDIETTDTGKYPGHKIISRIKVTATGEDEVPFNLIWTGTNTLNTPVNYKVYKTGEEVTSYYTYNTPWNPDSWDQYNEAIPKDADLYIIKMYNGESTSDNYTKFVDGSFLGKSLGKGTWDGSACKFNGATVKKATSRSADIDNRNDCNDVYKSFYNTRYVSFYEYEYIGKASEVLEHTHGLFEGEDDDGTTFYFRGDVDNNYVKFGKWNDDLPDIWVGYKTDEINDDYMIYSSREECENHSDRNEYNQGCTLMSDSRAGKDMYWRIVRINGDGSIRMIYDGTKLYNNGQWSQDKGIGYSDFNNLKGDNAYVGYMYGTAGASTYEETHANINDSTIKQYVDNWYQNNISGKSFESYIDTGAGFCGDRSISSGTGIGIDATRYSKYSIYINGDKTLHEMNASYKCNNNDLYTTKSATKGNMALTYPVGLISADEVAFAGAGRRNFATNYLYTNDYYFTMTPSYGGDYYCHINMYYIGFNSCGMGTPTTRPVINLKADVKLSGSGTASDPYTIIGAN